MFVNPYKVWIVRFKTHLYIGRREYYIYHPTASTLCAEVIWRQRKGAPWEHLLTHWRCLLDFGLNFLWFNFYEIYSINIFLSQGMLIVFSTSISGCYFWYHAFNRSSLNYFQIKRFWVHKMYVSRKYFIIRTVIYQFSY